MENENNSLEIGNKLEEIVKELVQKMGFSCEVSVQKNDSESGDSYACNIKTTESNFLIGQYGVNLDSLQHIARVIARKKIAEKANFTLDINSYRQEKSDSIVSLAKNMAEQSVLEKRAIVMRPMSPYERRLVHMALSEDDKIKTESIGDGEDRRIVIKPAELI